MSNFNQRSKIKFIVITLGTLLIVIFFKFFPYPTDSQLINLHKNYIQPIINWLSYNDLVRSVFNWTSNSHSNYYSVFITLIVIVITAHSIVKIVTTIKGRGENDKNVGEKSKLSKLVLYENPNYQEKESRTTPYQYLLKFVIWITYVIVLIIVVRNT